MPREWYLDIEHDFIVAYKGDVKLNKSGCLGGKSLETTTDVDLGPLLNVEVISDKLKVNTVINLSFV